MSLDSTVASESVAGGEVMASIDDTGRHPRLIIADITTDDAWCSIPATAAAHLDEWA